jgi:hypothetical protein
MRDTAGAPFVVTVAFDAAATKLDALQVIAFVCDGSVDAATTAHPRVSLGPNVWAEVHIARFADPPPVTVDVCSDSSFAAARAAATRLTDALSQVGWAEHAPR